MFDPGNPPTLRTNDSSINPCVPLVCPTHYVQLRLNNSREGKSFVCTSGCIFPVENGIPRFVASDTYAASFGLQWNKFRTIQLDSYTGLTISRDRLTRLLGGDLGIVKGKSVLEAGCGAGRFTECLLEAGANVFAADISTAVDANYENCSKFPNYFVCQADLVNLPVNPGQFDIVVCIGVVQHTPSPEKTMEQLCSYVKPGGMLVMDHYTHGYPMPLSRRLLRSFLIKRSPRFRMSFCRTLRDLLWPFHKMLFTLRKIPGIARVRSLFLRASPLVDYHDAYPEIGSKLLREWAFLDTHDLLTDFYKHLRSADEIRSHLEKCGMQLIATVYAGNGIEVRAQKPLLKAYADSRSRS
jgi:SAM-dependent methyltransferase